MQDNLVWCCACRGGTAVATGLSRSAARRISHCRDGAGKHLQWRADNLVASELGYQSRALGWEWGIRLHGARVSSFRVRLTNTDCRGLSVRLQRPIRMAQVLIRTVPSTRQDEGHPCMASPTVFYWLRRRSCCLQSPLLRRQGRFLI